MRKLVIIIILILVIVLLGAFMYSEIQKEIQKTACEQKGGRWEYLHHGSTFPSCNNPTSDAGKECTDSSQCESFCQAASGTLPGTQTVGNCYGYETALCAQEVKNGLADATLCE